MDNKMKQDLERRMLEKAREYLDLVREYIPDGSHADMAVWPDHLSVHIYKSPGERNGCPVIISAWADPRKAPMEMHL